MTAIASPLSPAFHADYPDYPTSAAFSRELARLHSLRNHEAVLQSKQPKRIFTLGTRNSKLAMVQTNIVKSALEERWPGIEFRIYGMTTSGDINTSTPLYLMGGKALWTKELEVELVKGNVDAIVHSLKDVPTEFPPGCELGAILEREDPSDALCVKAGLSYTSLDQFPDGSVIGTSSVRRVAQLRRQYPQLKFADVRGLVQTRLRKLDDPNSSFTALILASAGLIRLGLKDRITAAVTSPSLYHAVGQGAICMEMRSGDPSAAEVVGSLEDWKTGWAIRAERSMLHYLEGGCSVPVGCESFLVEEVDVAKCPVVGGTPKRLSVSLPANGISDGLPIGHPLRPVNPNDPHAATLTLTGTITSLAGTSSVLATRTRLIRSIAEAEQLGAEIARELIQGGGKAILEELGRHIKDVQGEDGKEIPTSPNGNGVGYPVITAPLKSAVNTAPVEKSEFAEKEGAELSKRRSVYKDGEVCQRPVGW
ncbi:hydroxymethylbilane synthase, partial [Phenoliferia sp. Uapishka_3]